MPDLKFTPISYADPEFLSALLDEEEICWREELGWDFAPVRRILSSFIEQRLLPGYVASDDHSVIGYTYFLRHLTKGIIGTLYASRVAHAQEMVDEILALSVKCLKETGGIRRIEAQIMPFNSLDLSGAFTRQGFRCYPRHYLEIDPHSYTGTGFPPGKEKIVHWDESFLACAAEVTLKSYEHQPDAQICEDYRTLQGCENYLRSLLENPGCGHFLPGASFVGLDTRGSPCGVIVGSRISERAGMIPQVAILPSSQGRGLGTALMSHCLSYFKTHGYRTVSLTVTQKNKRAYDWYYRLGFRPRKEFAAFVWDRVQA
jgi:ribosomal protein S18 acetylase RimI-like enzyme